MYIYITCTYTAPSVRLVAIAAFQTRHGIDVPDASKVGRKKKKKERKKEKKKKRNSEEKCGPTLYLSVKYT